MTSDEMNNNHEESVNDKEIRNEVEKLIKIINWYHKRGGLLPYDWHEYGQPIIRKLSLLLKEG